jgi:hypothetical protein
MINRLEDWPQRLATALDAAKRRPFVWGEHDCMLFASDVVLAITGHDYMGKFRGTYSTAQGAYLSLRRHGYADVKDAFARTLGEPLPSVFFAQRGDIVLFDDMAGRLGAGICIGEEIAVLVFEGLDYLPLERGKMAWRI